MLDSEGFVKAGWVHDLKLHQVKHNGDGITKFVVMARVRIVVWNNISKINVALINCLISRCTRNEFQQHPTSSSMGDFLKMMEA